MRSIWSCRTTERGRGSAIRPHRASGSRALLPDTVILLFVRNLPHFVLAHRRSKMGVACLPLFSLLSADLGRRSYPNSSPRGFFYLEHFKGVTFSGRF